MSDVMSGIHRIRAAMDKTLGPTVSHVIQATFVAGAAGLLAGSLVVAGIAGGAFGVFGKRKGR
jgi:hypothetical protein